MLSRHGISSCNRYARGPSAVSRSLATVVAEHATTSTEPLAPPRKPKRTELTTAVILNRSPLITRTPSHFEQEYYKYQARIQRALHNPFPHELYFQGGSPLALKFGEEERERERRAFGKPFGTNEEAEALAKASEDSQATFTEAEEEIEESQPRRHAADESNDVKSLDRGMENNLYLLVQEASKRWRFPQGSVESNELLHQAAQRDLHLECGKHMDTWIVGRKPIGIYQPRPSLESPAPAPTFFFKGHIFSGQARIDGKQLVDFAWLAKHEIRSRLEPEYWDGVKDMLSES